MLNRTEIPNLGKAAPLELREPECLTLANGMEVYVIDIDEVAVTRVDLVLRAGSVHQDKKLVADTVSSLLREGTKTLNSSQLAEKLDYHGAFFDVNVTKDTTALTLYTLTKHLPDLLPVMGEMLRDAVFPEEELNIHLERRRQEFLVNIEKVRYKASLEFNQLVFGKNTAYGQVPEALDFDRLNRADLLDFYKEYYVPEKSYCILSGTVDESVKSLVESHFGSGWQQGNRMEQTRLNYSTVDPLKAQFVEKKGSMQSAIRVGRQMVGKLHPDYNRFILLNTILGGYFGSRLMSNLREDKGFTYGVSSFVANYRHSGYFSIATEVNAEHTRAALDEIDKEIRRLRENRVGDEELGLVKNYIYGTFLRNFDGPFALAERFRAVRDFGLGFDFYRKSLEEILTTNATDLIETADKYLQADDLYQLVVGEMGEGVVNSNK
ncbi:MAG: insulinase family protein [Bacteroidales bacterium]|nr:insulinase family protein [Bacteroidales bacterium]